jgi:hypothetical protein
MAYILNPQINITSGLAIGSDKTVEVTYILRFTLLERLLAREGMQFAERIHLQEVDTPPNANDFLTNFDVELIPAEMITEAPEEGLLRTRTQTFRNVEVTGPDDDFSPNHERIRACIHTYPWPRTAATVQPAQACTPHELVNVTPGILEDLNANTST